MGERERRRRGTARAANWKNGGGRGPMIKSHFSAKIGKTRLAIVAGSVKCDPPLHIILSTSWESCGGGTAWRRPPDKIPGEPSFLSCSSTRKKDDRPYYSIISGIVFISHGKWQKICVCVAVRRTIQTFLWLSTICRADHRHARSGRDQLHVRTIA